MSPGWIWSGEATLTMTEEGYRNLQRALKPRLSRREKKRRARKARRERCYRRWLLGHHKRWAALVEHFDPLIDPKGLPSLRRGGYVADRTAAAVQQYFDRQISQALLDYSRAFEESLKAFDQPLFPRPLYQLDGG